MAKHYKCLLPHCRRLVRSGALMCDHHWLALPRDLRNALADTWNAGAPLKGHLINVRAAIRFLTPPVKILDLTPNDLYKLNRNASHG